METKRHHTWASSPDNKQANRYMPWMLLVLFICGVVLLLVALARWAWGSRATASG